MSREECLELLKSRRFGRAACYGPQAPVVSPVNFIVRSGEVLFRTRAGSTLARSMKDSLASFQVDEIAEASQAGWSVLVVGVAEWVTDTEELREIWGQEEPQPWAEGERNVLVSIRPSTDTGRRVYWVTRPAHGRSLRLTSL